MRKGQAISIDLILALLVFVSVIVGFFYVVSILSEKDETGTIKRQGEDIPRSLQANVSKFAFIKGNQIDIAKLLEFADQDYRQLQNSLGISNDFCIFIEDENGNVIPIEDSSGKKKAGIGSSKVTLGNSTHAYKCGEPITPLPPP